jgi:outer membrane protein OmpA-like peptidoglycan-associated protein
MKTRLVILFLILATAVPLFAQVQDGDWEFSPMVGMSYPGRELKRGANYSFGLAYNFTTHWAGEAQFLYTDTNLRHIDSDLCGLRLSAIYNIHPENSLVPYFKFGVGGRAQEPDVFDEVFSNDFLAHVGFGLKKFLSPRTAFKIETVVGYDFSDSYYNDYQWAHVPGGTNTIPSFYKEKNFYTFELMMGLSFIARKTPPPPPPPAPEPPPPPPPPPAPEPPPPPPPEPEMIRITLDESVLHFKIDSWAIPKDGEPALNDAIEKLNKYHALKINIIGYTCKLGSDSWNLTLSKRRAESVKKYLVEHGIAESRIEKVEGMGKANPIADNNTKEGRSKNRRVEITAVAPIEVPKN